MINKNKYKTYKQRNEAFDAYCKAHNCLDCPLVDMNHCAFAWLELDDETSEELISDLITEVCKFTICSKKEMVKKLLSYRDKIQQIWQKQDEEKQDD